MPPSSVIQQKDLPVTSTPFTPGLTPANLPRTASPSGNLSSASTSRTTIRPTISTRPSFEPQPHSLTKVEEGEGEESEQQEGNQEDEEGQRTAWLRAPFFTLISDLNVDSSNITSVEQTTGRENDADGSGTIYHPSKVHYIFSDDDAGEILTASLVRALESGSQHQPRSGDETQDISNPEAEEDDNEEESPTTATTTSSSSSTTFRKQPTHTSPQALPRKKTTKSPKSRTKGKNPEHTNPQREERIIIIDVNPTLDGIKSASSLTPNWQVLHARIENAPTFDNGSTNNSSQGLMLKIEGVSTQTAFGDSSKEISGLGIVAGRRKSGEMSASASVVMADEEMARLLEGFDRKMGVLRGVVGNMVPFVEGVGEAEGEGEGDVEEDRSLNVGVGEDGDDEDERGK